VLGRQLPAGSAVRLGVCSPRWSSPSVMLTMPPGHAARAGSSGTTRLDPLRHAPPRATLARPRPRPYSGHIRLVPSGIGRMEVHVFLYFLLSQFCRVYAAPAAFLTAFSVPVTALNVVGCPLMKWSPSSPAVAPVPCRVCVRTLRQRSGRGRRSRFFCARSPVTSRRSSR